MEFKDDILSGATKILLIYTGGTIGMVKDYKTGALKAFDFSELLKRIPELNQLDCKIDTVSFDKPIDSSNMRFCFKKGYSHNKKDE